VISILLYHQIAQVPEQNDPRGLAVPPQLFEQQMAYLHQAGYCCLSLGEAVRYLQEGLHLPRKSAVLTFDDGYQNLHSNMWPILDRFGFTATIFLVAGRAGCWSDWEGQTGPYAAPLLSWAEARELAQAGFTFGSHTLNHPRLTLLDDKQAMHEIRDSKEMMEDHLGVKVDLFSYPCVNFDARIQRMVAKSGYIAACGIDRGAWGLFNLWRVGCLSKDSMLSFALKAGGWYYRRVWLREQSPLGRPLARLLRYMRSIARSIQGKAERTSL
jgi:peptidoglycan/xylan/chitin deacetylase (PgdA/CDA1 family)